MTQIDCLDRDLEMTLEEAGKVFRGETRVAKEHLSISAMKLSSVHRSFDTCDAAARYFPA